VFAEKCEDSIRTLESDNRRLRNSISTLQQQCSSLSTQLDQLRKDTKDQLVMLDFVALDLKATIENRTTSVTTHFKKLTSGNKVFIV